MCEISTLALCKLRKNTLMSRFFRETFFWNIPYYLGFYYIESDFTEKLSPKFVVWANVTDFHCVSGAEKVVKNAMMFFTENSSFSRQINVLKKLSWFHGKFFNVRVFVVAILMKNQPLKYKYLRSHASRSQFSITLVDLCHFHLFLLASMNLKS